MVNAPAEPIDTSPPDTGADGAPELGSRWAAVIKNATSGQRKKHRTGKACKKECCMLPMDVRKVCKATVHMADNNQYAWWIWASTVPKTMWNCKKGETPTMATLQP